MKHIPSALVASILTILFLGFFATIPPMISVGVGIVAGALVVIVLMALSRGEEPETIAKEVVATTKAVVTEPASLFEERAANEQLASMYEKLVLSGKAPTVAPAVRELTVTLRDAVKRALEFSPGSQTTFNIVKLAKTDLPEQVQLFLTQSEGDRTSKESAFIAQLQKLNAKVTDLVSIINSQQADAFDAQADFIDLKFS